MNEKFIEQFIMDEKFSANFSPYKKSVGDKIYILTIFFRLPANASRIDFRRFIVELKSLKRYKNVFSLELLTLVDLNVRKGRDFLVGAILEN